MPGGLGGIDKSLSKEGIRADSPWGFAVYRVSYDNDAAWSQMLKRIEGSVRNALELQSRDDFLARHRWVTVDDPATYDRLKPDEIRTAFRTWANEELKRNSAERPISVTGGGIQEGSKDIGNKNTTYAWKRGHDYFAGARYNFCLVVDDLYLESLDNMPTGPVVKLVCKEFSPSPPEDQEMTVDLNEEREESDYPVGFWEDGVTDHEEEDVGWMYMPVVEYVEYYNDLCDADHWYECYVRPPLTFYGRNIEDAVGCWRTTARTGNANES